MSARIWRCTVCDSIVERRYRYCSDHKPNGPKPRPIADRVWAKVDKSEGCWLWTGSKCRNGYGKIGVGSMKDGTRGLATVTRVVWEITYGPIPNGLFVCHKCDTPACCRPDHLFLGTNADNLADMAKKGRSTKANRRLTDEQIRQIRDTQLPQSKIAARFGVSQAAIGRIVRRETYREVA